MAYIRVVTGPNQGKIFEIQDTPLTIGREENQILQILDQGVSRMHAEIFRLGELCFVRDLNSTNGTYVNNVRVTEELLKNGDRLLIGTTVLAFVDEAPSVPRRTVEFEEGDKALAGAIELPLARVAGDAGSRTFGAACEVARALSEAAEPGVAVERTLEVLARALRADAVYLFTADGGFAPAAVVRAPGVAAGEKVSRAILERVRTSGVPLLTADAGQDARFSASESVVLGRIRSVVCVPVLDGAAVEGLLYVHSSRAGAVLSSADLELAAAAALQLSLARRAFRERDRLRRRWTATAQALVTAMEAALPGGPGHARRTAEVAAALAERMGLSATEVHRVRLAALLHDVGDLLARHASRGGAAEPPPEEHVHAGERLLSGIEGADEILPGIRYHHERADGSGYPYRLRNSELPVLARIVIVANAFDEACARGGPGERGRPVRDVVRELARQGGLFDEDVLKALLRCYRHGSLAGALSGGSAK
jgi:response regulator RpfG family c-di-GMP phosphodiesterase/pSer/pThr/pTyr-binding forkhead associated (FHA) protein